MRKYFKGVIIMENKIKSFLDKWDDMLAAANEIEEFKYKFAVSVSSVDRYEMDREELISGVNKSFVKNGMTYNSSSSN